MPNRSALARPHFPLVRWLPLLIAVIAAVPPPELEAATLSTDASFEWPTAADADAANAAWVNLNNWTMTLTPGTPLPLVRRGAGAYRGGQHLEFTCDGSNAHTRTLIQDVPQPYLTGERYMLAVRLKATGTPPASGGVVLSMLQHPTSGPDTLVDEATIPYTAIEEEWRQHIVWEEVTTTVADEIRLQLEIAAMGTDPDYRVQVDWLWLEVVEDDPNAFLANQSFESLLPDMNPGDIARNALTDWVLDDNAAGNVRVRDDGGSRGPFYVSAEGHGGASWYSADLEDLDGAYLDRWSRYELSGDLRYGGTQPEDTNAAWLSITPPGGSGNGARNLITRNKIEYWKLEDEFKTYRVHGNKPRSQVPAGSGLPAWNIGDKFEIAFSPHFANQAGSFVEIDNVRLDRITPAEMFESDSSILIDPLRPVPTRFVTEILGSERHDSVYTFYLPVGLRILVAGNDDRVGESQVGERNGNFADIYDVVQGASDISIDGERYTLWTLTPTNLHHKATDVGPIYFETDLPVGSRVSVYYETSWGAYETTDGATTVNWPAGSSIQREVSIEVTQFPVLEKPANFVSGIQWIKTSDQIFWPGYLDNLRTFGFNSVAGQKNYDGYLLQEGAAPPQVLKFLKDARDAGYGVFSASSPWNGCSDAACSFDTTTMSTIENVPCPAYGLMADEDPYGGDNLDYLAELTTLAAWLHAVQADYMQFDSEGLHRGAKIALGEDPGDPHDPGGPTYDGCARCNKYLLEMQGTHHGAQMEDALVQMAIDRTQDVRDAITAIENIPLTRMSYYHTRAGDWTYHEMFDLDDMMDAGVVEFGMMPYYGTAETGGDTFRSEHEDAIAADKYFIPIFKPSYLTPASQPRGFYDLVLEIMGSGARGAAWWPYDYAVGADFYYWARALESILPVEHLLTTSTPMTGVDVSLVGSSPPESDRYGIKATAVKSGSHYLILVSSYGDADVRYEAPYWEGDIVVDLGENVTGTPMRLADRSQAGSKITVANKLVPFAFAPGTPGARTALFHLCSGACDTDGDGLDDADELESMGTDLYEADTDSDGLGDGDELNFYATDPLDSDSDGDGASDGLEIFSGTDPNDVGDFPGQLAVPLHPSFEILLVMSCMLAAGVRLRNVKLRA